MILGFWFFFFEYMTLVIYSFVYPSVVSSSRNAKLQLLLLLIALDLLVRYAITYTFLASLWSWEFGWVKIHSKYCDSWRHGPKSRGSVKVSKKRQKNTHFLTVLWIINNVVIHIWTCKCTLCKTASLYIFDGRFGKIGLNRVGQLYTKFRKIAKIAETWVTLQVNISRTTKAIGNLFRYSKS